MVIIITATMIVFALTTLILMKSHKTDPAQLSEPRTSLLTMGVQIICGDCSGDESRPLKTYLDRHGNCSQCGGHSYILAASRALYAQQIMAERRMESEAAASNGRVIPFEVPYGVRGARTEKIAV
jgi:Zn finger protein HypA/HybF involved in hydrogenase expression